MGKNKKKRRSQQRYPVPKPTAPVERALPETPAESLAPEQAVVPIEPVLPETPAAPVVREAQPVEEQTTLFESAAPEEPTAPEAPVSETETPQITENTINREEPTMPYTTESGPENVVTLKVVGVGGAGNNVVNRMVSTGTRNSTTVNSSSNRHSSSLALKKE